MDGPAPTFQTKTSGQGILNPQPSEEDEILRSYVVEINSRERDIQKYPDPTEFRYRFTYPFKSVDRIRLIGGTIPTVCTIAAPYNSFEYKLRTDRPSAAPRVCTVDPGVYTEQELLAAVQTSLVPGFTFTRLPTGQYKISRTDSSFVFFFLTSRFKDTYDQKTNSLLQINSLAKFLGFGPQDYQSVENDHVFTITTPYAVDPAAATSRLYLYLNADSKYDMGTIDRGGGRRKPFAVLYPDSTLNLTLPTQTPAGFTSSGMKYMNKDIYHPVYVSLPQPMSRISAIDIELRDEYDRPVQISGRDFTLLLEVSVYEAIKD